MGCSVSTQTDDGYSHAGSTVVIHYPLSKVQNHTYSGFQNGYSSQHSQWPSPPYNSPQEAPNQAWYPNQPPEIASYNHGVATVNPPLIVQSQGKPSRTAEKQRRPETKRSPPDSVASKAPAQAQLPSSRSDSKAATPPGSDSNQSRLDEAELWRSEELRADEVPEPVEELEEPHPDHELILGVTEDYAAFEARFQSTTDGRLFEDPDFPADSSSLYLDAERNKGIVWKRPLEICDEPLMFVDGTSREDVIQGSLSDCWFLAPCAGIAQHKDLIRKIIPDNQPLFPPGYIGAIHFRFWRFGRWVDVVVDDRLPTKKNRLVFATSSEKNEFWPALMEKAYAKLNGTYQGLCGGMAADAFVDLTGGLSEVFLFSQESVSPDFYSLLYKTAKTRAFLACSKKHSNFRNVSADDSGIVPGHSYTISDAQVVALNKKKKKKQEMAKLLRIRNPWGNSMEWKGDWSDNSSMWKKLEKADQERMNPKIKDDGEFWMSFEDFCKKFNSVITCTLGPDFNGDGKADINGSGGGFYVADMRGHWIKNISAGGCANYETYYNNPQFSFTLLQPDDVHSYDSAEKRGKCSVIVAVIQEYRRSKKNLAPKRQQIGFRVYETDDPNSPQGREQLRDSCEVGRSGSFINYRQVYRRFTLAPGSYTILPATFQPNIAGAFMVRLFSEKRAVCKALGSFAERP